MGIRFEVEFPGNPSRTFIPGQTLYGILHVGTEKKYETGGIQVILKGKARVRCPLPDEGDEDGENTSLSTSSSSFRRNETVKRDESSPEVDQVGGGREDYFHYEFYAFGKGTRVESLPAGHHRFPIEFRLPPHLPSSFAFSHGSITYYIKAILKRPKKDDLKVKAPFNITGILDLNEEPGADKAVKIQVKSRKNGASAFLSCFTPSKGPINLTVMLDKSGFVPLEPLQFTAEIRNHSDKPLDSCCAELIQEIVWLTGGSSSGGGGDKSNRTSRVILRSEGPTMVAAGESEVWLNQVVVPAQLPPTSLGHHCGIIDVNYTLKFQVEVAGFVTNLRAQAPIIIGTIPLRTTQNKEEKGRMREEMMKDVMESSSDYSPTAPPLPPPPSYAEAIQEQLPYMGHASQGNKMGNIKKKTQK